MAIYAHEGLPRSGKSYEAAVYVILPALKSGRKVWAYVEGLNHEQFAELAGISVHQCRKQLIQLQYEDVIKIPERSREEEWKDGWIVIDEIQDFYPGASSKLDQSTSRFVTQHGHDGLDILIMGQSMSDVHTLWRNRINQKTQFLKLEAIGKENSYKWTSYNGVLDGNGRIKFNKITSDNRKYDSQYFGLYKSHNMGTTNTGNHQDERANIYNTALFRYVIPVFIVVAIYSVYYVYTFFSEERMVNKEAVELHKEKYNKQKSLSDEFEVSKNLALNKPVIEPEVKPVPDPTPMVEIPEEKPPIDYLDEIVNKYRPRLIAFIATESRKFGVVEFLDSSYRVKEKLNFEQLEDMGWEIEIRVDYIYLNKEDIRHLVTSWPIESTGRVSEHTSRSLSTNSSNSGMQLTSNGNYSSNKSRTFVFDAKSTTN